jgi:transcriptional regulator with XRE-family HTH domain
MHEDFNLKVGEIIKKIRLEREITQADLAKKLGISRPWLTEIEKGNGALSAEQFVFLLSYFNQTLDDFFPSNKGYATLHLQNALVRLGASFLKENDELMPSEKFRDMETVVFETVILGESALLLALVPVIVKNVEIARLQRIASRLQSLGLESRFWWLIEGTYLAIEKRMEGYQSKEWSKIYRQSKWVLGQIRKLSHFFFDVHRGNYPEDILDKTISSQKTYQEVKRLRDSLAIRWRIVTRIRETDFVNVLVETEKND